MDILSNWTLTKFSWILLFTLYLISPFSLGGSYFIMQIKSAEYFFNPSESGMLHWSSAAQIHIPFDALCYRETNLRPWDERSISHWLTSFLSSMIKTFKANYSQNHLIPLETDKLFSALKVLTVFADNNEKITPMLTTCGIWLLSHA